jgi:hypothetical protein
MKNEEIGTIDRILLILGLTFIALTLRLGFIYTSHGAVYLELIMYVLGFVSSALAIILFIKNILK